MTVGALISIILGAICIIVGIVFTVMCISDGETGGAIASLLFGLILGGLLIGGAIFYLNTESGKRAIKDMKSELGEGIHRTVAVYDINGELIKEYKGKFDVETRNDSGTPYIVFDDEKELLAKNYFYKMGVMCGDVLYTTYKFDDFSEMIKKASEINDKYKSDMMFCNFVIQSFKDNSYDFQKSCFSQINVRVNDVGKETDNIAKRILQESWD